MIMFLKKAHKFWSIHIYVPLEPMSFISNDTSSLCSKVEGEVTGSSPTECVCKLPVKKKFPSKLHWFVINNIT